MNSLIANLGLGFWVATWALALAAYIQINRKTRQIKREEQLVMSRARQKALATVQQAKDQAVDIIANSKISANESKSKLEENIEKISAEQMREFQKTLQNISNSVEEDATKEMEGFRKALEMETIQSQQLVASKIRHKYDEAEQEVGMYQKQKMDEVESKINLMIADVIKQMVGKTIPLNEHQKLIIEALEKAKKEHGLG